MKRKVFVITLLALTPVAMAQAATPYSGVRMGWSYYQDGCKAWATGCDRDALGAGVFGGVELNEWLALEAGYTWLGSAKGEYRAGNVDGTMQMADFSTKFSYPLAKRLDLYGRLGATHWWSTVEGDNYHQSDRGWDALFATGLEYALSERWRARLEYQYIDGLGSSVLGQSDHHFTSIALVYRFAADPAPVVAVVPPVILPSPENVALAPLSAETLFAFDSANLRDPTPLHPLLERLQQAGQSRLTMTGHTDNQGSDAYNLHLSQQRADAVARWLVEQGIDPARLEAKGAGELHPVASNEMAAGRALNRRVELHWQP